MYNDFIKLFKILIFLDRNKQILHDMDIKRGFSVISNLQKIETKVTQSTKELRQSDKKRTVQILIKVYWYYINYIDQLYLIHDVIVKIIRNYDKQSVVANKIKQESKAKNDVNFINVLYDLIEILEQFHTDNNMNIISDEMFKEEKENIQDFMKVEKKLQIAICELELADHVEEVISALIYVHLEILNYVWHIEQINELIKKIIIYYDPTCILESPVDNDVITEH